MQFKYLGTWWYSWEFKLTLRIQWTFSPSDHQKCYSFLALLMYKFEAITFPTSSGDSSIILKLSRLYRNRKGQRISSKTCSQTWSLTAVPTGNNQIVLSKSKLNSHVLLRNTYMIAFLENKIKKITTTKTLKPCSFIYNVTFQIG